MLAATDNLISERDLARKLGRTWKTIRNWRKRGIAGVYLKPTCIGARIYYRPEDLDAFQKAVDAARNPPAPLTCRQQKAIDRAVDSYLRRKGMLK